MVEAASSTNPQRQVARAIGDVRRGVPVIIADDRDKILVLASELAEPAGLAAVAAVAVPPMTLILTANRAAVLNLAAHGSAVVAIDATRLSPETICSLGDATGDLDLPLRGPFRVLPAPPLAAAAVQLCKVARMLPAPLVGTLAANPGDDFLSVSAAAVRDHDESLARSLTIVSSAQVPLADAPSTRIVAFRPADGGIEHVAIIVGDPPHDTTPLVRLHSECFTGDLLASLRCDCGQQLRGAVQLFATSGGGILLYLAQEGRGIGLINKLRAYALQDQGFDTMEANRRLGFEDDERLFLPAAEMLQRLGFKRIRLLTNNPDKVAGLERHGIVVSERVPHAFPANPHNERYFDAKVRKGHRF
jgi:GTP cyclohydrolase II